jgi:hypothetical protein
MGLQTAIAECFMEWLMRLISMDFDKGYERVPNNSGCMLTLRQPLMGSKRSLEFVH